MVGIFFSCENNLSSVSKVTFKSTDPDDRTSDLHLIYTDSGYAKVELNAKMAESFSKPTRHILFKEGIKLIFFDANGNKESVLTALFGKINQETGEMFVRDSVRLYSYTSKETLETEELFWNQKNESLFTEKNVIVHTTDGVFYGDGIRTSQDFKRYEFIRPKGKITIN
jgi:LPS export ABC transporter protein LptC